jgi:hypothetical protein
MKKKALQFAFGLLIISTSMFAQSWSGNDLNTNIYRNGNIGIGTTLYNGNITFGAQGTHLSIGRVGFSNQIILATGWTSTNSDFTDIMVPGAAANSALLRLQANGNVGIGIQDPWAKLDIRTTGSTSGDQNALNLNNPSTDAYGTVSIIMGSANESSAMISQQRNNLSKGGTLIFNTSDASGTNQPRMFINDVGNIGIGTLVPGSYKLAVEGKIAARGVKVTLQNPFPDYVFDSTYQLRPLAHLEQYINQNKHLPGIPSAKEVEKEGGVELGEMNVKLLEKIEELSLYIIEVNKKLQEQQEEIERMKKLIPNNK